MTPTTARLLAVGLVLAAVGLVVWMWAGRPAPELPRDHAQVAPGARFDDAATAVNYYRTALRRDPASAELRVRLAHALLQLGEDEGTPAETIPEAEALLEEAVAMAPGSVYARSLQAKLLNKLHRFEDARDVSRALLAEHPALAFAQGTLVDALVELGEYDQAVAVSDRLQALKPGLPAYARASYLRELHGDGDGAIAAMRMAADAAPGGSPDRAWALTELATLYLGAAKPDTAAYLYRGVLEERPNHVPALAGLGHVALVQGDIDTAIERLEEARALRPIELADELLVEAYTAAGDDRRAQAAAGRVHDALLAARAFGENVDMEEADFLIDRGQELGRSLRLAREQQARRPGHLHANETYAWALHAHGRSDEAVPFIERAMRLGTGDAMVHYRAAQIYREAGRLAEAARHLQAALDGNLHVESPSTAAEARTLLASLEAVTDPLASR